MKEKQRIRSWGNIKGVIARVFLLKTEKLPDDIGEKHFIPYGNGRSYGDSALNDSVLKTRELKAVVSFDENQGILCCQSGILMSDLIKIIVPKGWFFEVTPGTSAITIGGAVAGDVHGKNHHEKGTFCDHVISIKLLLPNNEIKICSQTQNTELFFATCGGCGLTGIILEVTFKLQAIKSAFIDQEIFKANNLEELLDLFGTHVSQPYRVAWIDTLARRDQIGKGTLIVGKHRTDLNFNIESSKKINIPTFFPSFVLNKFSIKYYNWLRLKKQSLGVKQVSLETFFYPLDRLKNWNRIYGMKGLVQYQCVIPKEHARSGLKTLLEKIQTSKHTAYLTVLKDLGKENENLLSFPIEGYTLAMDFKNNKGLFLFLEELDAIVKHYKGRLYLVKDSRMSKEFFEIGYPKVERFRTIRKEYRLERLESYQSKRLGI